MKVMPIVEHLRKWVKIFNGRVAGGIDFESIKTSSKLELPAAYVVVLSDDPGELITQNSYRQEINDSFDVCVVLKTIDERGQSAADSLHDIRAALLRALAGWVPIEGYEPVVYDGAELISIDRAVTIYRYSFSAAFFVGRDSPLRNLSGGQGGSSSEAKPAETWQELELDGLPALEGIDISVDAIDPMADRNIQYPGPDGRVEFKTSMEFSNEQ